MIRIKIGGSILIPDEKGYNEEVIKKLIKTIKEEKQKKYSIITGGGWLARKLQEKSKEAIKKLTTKEQEKAKDWIGIAATKINAEHLKTIIKKETGKSITVEGGTRPGQSTDAVMLKKATKKDTIIKITKTGGILRVKPENYQENKKYPLIRETTWEELEEMMIKQWKPGMKQPLDPEAIKTGRKKELTMIITSINELEKIIKGKKYRGTTIKTKK